MKFRQFFILIILTTLTVATATAQQQAHIDTCLTQRDDAYMNRQSKALLGEVAATLREYPPQYPVQKPRWLALLLMDAVMHDKYAAFRPPVQQFFHKQVEQALKEIETTKVEEGAMIWKFYDMGFIVRTKSVTLAFDLTRATSSDSKGFALNNDIMQRLVDQCDALFISHRHDDHADMWVAGAFIDAGKPVVAPPQVWKKLPIHAAITHLERESHKKQPLKIKNGDITLDVVIYPGHQMSKTENNVSLIYTPEGITVSHLGDQINEGDFIVDYAWIDEVAKYHKVDIFLPNCWTNELYRIVLGFDPELVIPGHENELGHPVWDRVPFWGDSEYLQLTYPELKASDYPLILMTWGESYHYTKEK